MKIALLSVLILFVMPGPAAGFDHSHKLWGKVLKANLVGEGRVNYRALKLSVKEDKAHPLTKYLAQLSEVTLQDFQAWSKANQMAFLINAYNAFTVKLIIDKYPVRGIKKTVGFLSNPWKKEFFSLFGGKIKSLDPIEHEWLRPKYKDARIHAAVNCASISCPVLQPQPFTGKKLENQLELAMRQFLADGSRNRYLPEKGELHLSKIFDWFEEDFEQSYGSVKKAIEKLGPPEAKRALKKKGKIKYMSYNWNLNDGSSLEGGE